jgi:hypothetical protein
MFVSNTVNYQTTAEASNDKLSVPIRYMPSSLHTTGTHLHISLR